ncbi:MAG: cell division protein ZapA [Candidatus Eisenbacteria bacterium]|nr:cell division protein ZapA [Candidatus Eisenbacteria bacterium]
MDESKYKSVTIMGEEYRVSGETAGTPLPDLAAYVDDKMNQLRRLSGVPDPKRIAVMTSLNIADELFRERARWATLQAEMLKKVARIGSALDRLTSDSHHGPA